MKVKVEMASLRKHMPSWHTLTNVHQRGHGLGSPELHKREETESPPERSVKPLQRQEVLQPIPSHSRIYHSFAEGLFEKPFSKLDITKSIFPLFT